MFLVYLLLEIIIVLSEDLYTVCSYDDIAKYEDISASEGYEDFQVLSNVQVLILGSF